jgi:hypothetical protein
MFNMQIEVHGYGDQCANVIQMITSVLLAHPYVEVGRISFSMVEATCFSFDRSKAMPFVRVYSVLERDQEIAFLIQRETNQNVYFIHSAAQFPR